MDHVNERLARLKHLLGIVEEEQDGLLSTALQAVEDQVLNYLGREELPPELERALLLMTASYWKGAALGGGGAATGGVTAVKRGDVSVSFAGSGGGAAGAGTFELADGGTFFGWRETLNGYRKLRK